MNPELEDLAIATPRAPRMGMGFGWLRAAVSAATHALHGLAPVAVLVLLTCRSATPEQPALILLSVSEGEAATSKLALPVCDDHARTRLAGIVGDQVRRCLPSPSGDWTFVTVSDPAGRVGGLEEPLAVSFRGERAINLRQMQPNFSVGYAAVWSPDGSRIAVTGAFVGGKPNAETPQQVFVFDTTAQRLSQAGEIAGNVFQLAWSPDGARIAAVAAASEDDIGDRPHGDLFVVSVDGTGSLRLTTGQRVISPSWNEDGSKLAVADQLQPQLLFFTRGGAACGSVDLAPLAQHKLNQVQRISWRPGGELLILTADFDGEAFRHQQWSVLRHALASGKGARHAIPP